MKRIPGFSEYWISENGEIFRQIDDRLDLIPTKTNVGGYKYIYLSGSAEGKKGRTYQIQRLMAMAYLEFNPKLHVDHINGIKTDNRLENLEMVTPKENLIRRYKLQGPPMRLKEYVDFKRNQKINIEKPLDKQH